MGISNSIGATILTRLQGIAGRSIRTQRMTRTSLVYLSHVLERLITQYQVAATLLVGFQFEIHWEQERPRYQTISTVAESIWVFASDPITPIDAANCYYVPLSPDHPLMGVWFLWIRAPQFSVVMCGIECQDTASSQREFDTFWSFEPEILAAMLTTLLEVGASPALTALRAQYDDLLTMPLMLDPRLITEFLQAVVEVEETLNRHLQASLDQQRLMNQALREQQRINNLLMETCPTLMIVCDQHGRILELNELTAQTIGYTRDELIGQDFGGHLLAGLEVNSASPPLLQGEYSLYHRDGRALQIDWQSFLIDDHEASLTFSFGIDVTSQRMIEQRLSESELRFQKLTEDSPDLIMLLSLSSQAWIYLNRSDLVGAELLMDRPLPEYIPLLIHPDDQAQAWQYWQDLAHLQEGQVLTLECRAISLDNWYQLRSNLYKRNATGQADQVIVTVTEITERKLIEGALRESKARFQRVIDSIEHHIYAFEVDRDGHLQHVYLSPHVTQLTGYTMDTFIENPSFWVTDVIAPEDREIAVAQYQDLLEGKSRVTEYRLHHKDGAMLWVEDEARCEIDPVTGSRSVYGLVRDITVQKAIEWQLRQQEKLQNALHQERELNQLKTNLMNTLSHELRTPLATILSVCEIVDRLG